MCVDYTDHNWAIAKDNFLLSQMETLVDRSIGHGFLLFLDAFSGYHQIPLSEADRPHNSFITDRRLYQYKVISFRLKNAGATYQRMVNKLFKDQIGQTMEVYIDDMLIKGREFEEHLNNMQHTFDTLRTVQLKLNPTKCTFGAKSDQFSDS